MSLYYLKFYNKHVYFIMRKKTIFRLKEKSSTQFGILNGQTGTGYRGNTGLRVALTGRYLQDLCAPGQVTSLVGLQIYDLKTPNSISRSKLFIRIISFMMSWNFH